MQEPRVQSDTPKKLISICHSIYLPGGWLLVPAIALSGVEQALPGTGLPAWTLPWALAPCVGFLGSGSGEAVPSPAQPCWHSLGTPQHRAGVSAGLDGTKALCQGQGKARRGW